VSGRPYSDAELDAAIEALGDRARFREAESVVQRAAPRLQRILAQALADGGWFEGSHDDEVRKAATAPGDDAARISAVQTLLAEETRMGMLVGVAVGWALATELQARDTTEETTE
jgi:hypothetical protein